MSTDYNSVSQTNTTFGNPRQKTWAVFHNAPFWTLKLTTNSFGEAQDLAKSIISQGGIYSGTDRVMVVEIVPNDIVMTPTV